MRYDHLNRPCYADGRPLQDGQGLWRRLDDGRMQYGIYLAFVGHINWTSTYYEPKPHPKPPDADPIW